jgi:putative ABC transport system permease protein
MVSGEFIKFVLIASVVAWLISYYSMSEWLKVFAYHTEVDLTTFLISSLAALVIALATVGFQAAKAATANPVEALKYE